MKSYDAIVIGAGIAGLGVAGLLQERGHRTLVLEKTRSPGGRSKTIDIPGGWKLDTGTHCVELGEFSPCAELLKRLGKTIPWSRNIQGAMLYDEGQWKPMMEYLNLTKEDERNLTDLQNWIRTADEGEIDVLDQISLTRLIEEKVPSPRVAEFVRTVGMVQTTLTDTDIISAGEFVAIYQGSLRIRPENAIPFDSVRMPLGGIVTMIRAMEEAVTERGGTIRYKTKVRKVTVEPGTPTEVATEEESWRAPIVVVAAPIWDMLKFLPMDDMARLVPEWARRMESLKMETSASMGFNIGTTVPLFTEPYYLSAWSLPGGELPLQILGHTNFDDTIAPPGHMIAIIGACCTPAQALDEGFREKSMTAYWELVNEMFPLLKGNLAWRHDGYYVGIDGLSRSPGLTGRYRPPVYLDDVPGLYFAGDCFTGRGVGMNSSANSAMHCVDAIAQRHPLP